MIAMRISNTKSISFNRPIEKTTNDQPIDDNEAFPRYTPEFFNPNFTPFPQQLYKEKYEGDDDAFSASVHSMPTHFPSYVPTFPKAKASPFPGDYSNFLSKFQNSTLSNNEVAFSDKYPLPYDQVKPLFQQLNNPKSLLPESSNRSKKEIKEQLLLNLNLLSQITDQKSSQSLQKELQKVTPNTLDKIIDKVIY